MSLRSRIVCVALVLAATSAGAQPLECEKIPSATESALCQCLDVRPHVARLDCYDKIANAERSQRLIMMEQLRKILLRPDGAEMLQKALERHQQQ